MKIVFTMSVRDELPDLLDRLARQYGQAAPFERTQPIDLRRMAELPAVPRVGETVWAVEGADPLTVREVAWDLRTGEVRVGLGNLDTDELGEEDEVVEFLLDRGWEVDAEAMGWDVAKE